MRDRSTRRRTQFQYVRRLLKFGLVGTFGLLVNTALLALSTEWLGVHYLVGAVIATQGSTASNFFFTEVWVFRSRPVERNGLSRFGLFWAMNNALLLIRAPFLWVFTTFLGIHYLISNLVTLVALMLARYSLSEFWIWRDLGLDPE